MPAENNRSYTKVEVANEAARIRSMYFGMGDPMKGIVTLLADKDGVIKVAPGMPEETLRINDDKSFVVNIPNNTSPLRDNFTIAHELGHYFLHTDFNAPGSVTFNRAGSSRAETEANWFAAELLMPENEFRVAAQEFNNDPRLVAARFGVSGAAARVRMSVLGLI